jgi:hypothetical protein
MVIGVRLFFLREEHAGHERRVPEPRVGGAALASNPD